MSQGSKIARRVGVVGLPLAFMVALAAGADAGSWPAGVTSIAASAAAAQTVTGKLDLGKQFPLGWAAQSSMSCFPATENVNFQGNHVMYATAIPAQSEMTITATPDDPTLDLSLYAYTLASTDFTHVAPNVSSAVACEASYDAAHDSNPGQPEKVKLVATTQPYNVVIGVAGAKGARSGGYKLKVELATKQTVASATLVPTALTVAAGKASATGNLSSGGVIDLSWAANSSVACFPATENVNFNGNHVLYKIPLPAQSEMTIKATPSSSSLDLSVYAYTQATGKAVAPPGVTSVVSCEAGYDAQHDHNPGVAESIKLISVTAGYDVIVGVAGANGVKTGAFTLSAEIKPR